MLVSSFLQPSTGGQGSLRQAIMCDYNNKSNGEQRLKSRHRSNVESKLALPCYTGGENGGRDKKLTIRKWMFKGNLRRL